MRAVPWVVRGFRVMRAVLWFLRGVYELCARCCGLCAEFMGYARGAVVFARI